MSTRKYRNSSKVERLILELLAESVAMTKADIRAKLSLYGGTVVNSGISYLLLTGKIVEYYDGKVQLIKLENEK